MASDSTNAGGVHRNRAPRPGVGERPTICFRQSTFERISPARSVVRERVITIYYSHFTR